MLTLDQPASILYTCNHPTIPGSIFFYLDGKLVLILRVQKNHRPKVAREKGYMLFGFKVSITECSPIFYFPFYSHFTRG